MNRSTTLAAAIVLVGSASLTAESAEHPGEFGLKVAWIDSGFSVGVPTRVWLGVVNRTGGDVLVADAGKNAIEMVRCGDGTGYGGDAFYTTHTFPKGVTQADVHLVPNGGEYYFYHEFVPKCGGLQTVTFSARVIWSPGRDVKRFNQDLVSWPRQSVRARVSER